MKNHYKHFYTKIYSELSDYELAHYLFEVRDNVLYNKISRYAKTYYKGCIYLKGKFSQKVNINKELVLAWLITKRQELHGEYARHE